MGTTYTIKLVDETAPSREELVAIEQRVAERLAEIDALMSTYREDSEISRLNRAPAGQSIPLSSDTLEVLELAQRVSQESGGAFDVTVAPLVAAWGFGPGGRVAEPPLPERLASLRRLVGSDLLELDSATSSARKREPGVAVDLNSIAPGWAIDELSELLVELGHPRTMVELGGELRLRGEGPAGPWQIGIERPVPEDASLDSAEARQRTVQRVLALVDTGIATSGDYRSFYSRNDARYSHTINPETGTPVAHQGASVSVLHPRAALADAYATTLMVLGPEEGLAWANARNLAALFLVHSDDGFEERTTKAMRFVIEGTLAPAPNSAALDPEPNAQP